MKKQLYIVIALLLILLIVVGCSSADDPFTDDLYVTDMGVMGDLSVAGDAAIDGDLTVSGDGTFAGDLYTENIYPTGTLIYDIGSDTFAFADGYIETLYTWNGTAWQSVIGGGVGAEVDPIFTTSNASSITAANITAWSSLVSSQWVADVNGIHYTGGVGIHTNASATGLLALYSSDGVSNDPVLEVADNSASAEAVGIRVNMTGAKTDYADGIYITNIATSGTAGADKYGVRIKNTGNWNGAGAVNYGLYIEEPTGGTKNIGAFIDGTLDMSSNQIINVTDPTNNQDAATKYYVDNNAYGGLYEDSAGSDITITTAGTYYKWVTSTAGIDNLTTASAAGDNITINAGGDGAYRVTAHLSASSDHNDRLIHMAVFLNGVKLDQASCEVFIKFAAEEHSIGSGGLVALVEDDVLDLRITGDHNGEVITVKHAGISLNRIAR